VYGYGIDIEQSIVDSVYYDTLNRKHIRLAQRQHLQSFKAEFIEGVGSNAGPFYKRQSCYIYNFFLLCSYKDGMPSYINSYYKQKPNPCDPLGQLAVGIIGDKNQLHPYPNPVNDFLQIDVPNYSKSTITITDITGRVMETFISNDKIKLNTRNYPAGCYIVLLKNDSGSFVAKFMKE
jgi:hypothetical protein